MLLIISEYFFKNIYSIFLILIVLIITITIVYNFLSFISEKRISVDVTRSPFFNLCYYTISEF